MARERMVTRTVIVTKCEVLCVDVTTVETTVQEYDLSGNYADTTTALKALKKAYETDTFKVVAIQKMTENEVLYGMPELDFIKQAKVLNNRRTNMIEIYEILMTNTSATWFNQWAHDMQISGWEIVINDGKFYMQRRITL